MQKETYFGLGRLNSLFLRHDCCRNGSLLFIARASSLLPTFLQELPRASLVCFRFRVFVFVFHPAKLPSMYHMYLLSSCFSTHSLSAWHGQGPVEAGRLDLGCRSLSLPSLHIHTFIYIEKVKRVFLILRSTCHLFLSLFCTSD